MGRLESEFHFKVEVKLGTHVRDAESAYLSHKRPSGFLEDGHCNSPGLTDKNGKGTAIKKGPRLLAKTVSR